MNEYLENLEILKECLLDESYDSNSIINFIKNKNININTYIPVQSGLQMPLIYYCCRRGDLKELFIYLLNKNVDLTLNSLDMENNPSVDLILYAEPVYMKTLAKHGCKISPLRLKSDIIILITKGNIDKILTLLLNNIITNEILYEIIHINNIPFITLDNLFEKLIVICQTTMNPVPIMENLIEKYIGIFKLFFKNDVKVNLIDIESGDMLAQRILNSYIIDLITLMMKYKPNFSKLEFLHISNFDISVRQILTPIYNLNNFNKIKELVKPYLIKKINKINKLKNKPL